MRTWLCSKVAIFPIQRSNFPAEVLQAAVVVDDIVGSSEPVLATGLGCENSPGLVDRLAIPCKQSLQLRVLIAIDYQDSIDKLDERRARE